MGSRYEELLEEFAAGRSGFSGNTSSGVSNGVDHRGPGFSNSKFTAKFGPGDGNNGHGNDANRFDPSNPGKGKALGKNMDKGPDGNNGHGNDEDGFDESNPGKKPVDDLPSLFTTDPDSVNFNDLSDPTLTEDVVTKNANDGMHEALAGNDVVYLPYSTTVANEIGYDTTITFNGGDGDDYIKGGGRGSNANMWTQVDDKIDGGAGDDTIWGGEGNDVINGGDGNDTIYSGYDLSSHNWGIKSIFYSNGYDTDYVDGGAGDDYIVGSWGNDELHGGDGNDYVHGGMGLYNASGNDLIYGEAGNDWLEGGYGNNTIYGGSGDDNLRANSGSDTFIGGTGNDKAYGGSGNDLFIHNSGDSNGADYYRGDGGYDTLKLNLTQVDYDASLAELAGAQAQFDSGDHGSFNLASLGISGLSIENIDVTVDGIGMDFMDDYASIGSDFG